MPQGRQVTQLNGQYVDEDPALLADLDLLAWGLLATLKSASASQKPDQQSQIAKSNVAVCCLDGSHYVVACNGVHDATYTMVPNAAMSLQDLAIRATVKDEVVVEATDKLGELVQEKKKLYSVTHRGPDQKLHKRYYAPMQYNFTPHDHIASFIKSMLADAATPMPPPTKVTLLTPTADFAAHGEMRLLRYFGNNKPTFIGVSKPCCEHCANVLDKERVRYSRWAPLAQQMTSWKSPEQIESTKPVDLPLS